MRLDKRRESRRKERAQFEVERMVRRYENECGECQTRLLSDEEREELQKARKGRADETK